MTGEQDKTKKWDSFYARTMHLPSPKLTAEFLNDLPAQSRVLDFGAGTGAWAAAFLRDRPDLVIDVLDRNIEKAAALPEDFSGNRFATRFQEYRAPDTPYDAIWAQSVLFFLPPNELDSCFHELSSSLASGGVLAFTMVDDCKEAALMKFHGMSESALRKMLDKEGFELVKISRHAPLYGSQQMPIPTFDIFARKR